MAMAAPETPLVSRCRLKRSKAREQVITFTVLNLCSGQSCGVEIAAWFSMKQIRPPDTLTLVTLLTLDASREIPRTFADNC